MYFWMYFWINTVWTMSLYTHIFTKIKIKYWSSKTTHIQTKISDFVTQPTLTLPAIFSARKCFSSSRPASMYTIYIHCTLSSRPPSSRWLWHLAPAYIYAAGPCTGTCVQLPYRASSLPSLPHGQLQAQRSHLREDISGNNSLLARSLNAYRYLYARMHAGRSLFFSN